MKNLKAIADFYKVNLKNVIIADFFNERFLQGKFYNHKGRFLSIVKDSETRHKELRIYHISKNKIHRIIFSKKLTPKQFYNKNKIYRANTYRIVFLEIIQCLEFIDKFGIEQIPHQKLQNRLIQKTKRLKCE